MRVVPEKNLVEAKVEANTTEPGVSKWKWGLMTPLPNLIAYPLYGSILGVTAGTSLLLLFYDVADGQVEGLGLFIGASAGFFLGLIIAVMRPFLERKDDPTKRIHFGFWAFPDQLDPRCWQPLHALVGWLILGLFVAWMYFFRQRV